MSQSCSLAYSMSISANGKALKGQVPGGEPGILPLVRHGQDAHRVQVLPVHGCGCSGASQAAVSRGGRRRAIGRRRRDRSAWSRAARRTPAAGCAVSPPCAGRMEDCVEFVGFAAAVVDDAGRHRRAALLQRRRSSDRSARHATCPPSMRIGPIVNAGLASPVARDCARLAVDDVPMEGILDIGATVDGRADRTTAGIGFVVCEKRVPPGGA